MVVDQLLLDLLGHSLQGVVGSLQLALKARQGRGNLVLHLSILSLSEAGVEGVTLHGTTATDAGGHDKLILLNKNSKHIKREENLLLTMK